MTIMRAICFTGAVLGILSSEGAAQNAARLAALAAGADAVLMGTCLQSGSRWDENGRLIVTETVVEPERVFRGRMAGPVRVRTLGGTVGDVSMGASHGAVLDAGERVVLFLRESAHGDYHVVHGGREGRLDVGSVEGEVRIGDSQRSLSAFAAALGEETER